MSKIPLVLGREADELLYSWLLRLARINGFDVSRSFINGFITPNATESEKSRRVLDYSLLKDFEDIYSALDNAEDKQDLFLTTSLFPYYRLFLTPEQQAALLDTAFQNNANDNPIQVTQTKMISQLRFCPECLKEERITLSHFYYHREHQLPGVTMCQKHGCALKVYKGTPMHELDIHPKAKLLKPEQNDLEFSLYSQSLLALNIDGNLDQTKKIIRKSLQEKYADNLTLTQKAFEENSPYGEDSKLFKTVWKQIHSDQYMEAEAAVKFLMFLFPDPADFAKNYPVIQPSEDFLKALEEKSCRCTHTYSESLVELQHDCGFTFLINPYEFINAWHCPACERDKADIKRDSLPVLESRDKDLFVKEIEELTGKEYSLVGPYRDMKHTVKIRHNTCSSIQKFKPAAFLDGARCKKCTKMLKYNQFEEAVTSLSNGEYRLIAKRTANLYTIENTLTGFRKDMSQAKILQELRRPTPSLLLPLQKKGDESFTKSKKDVVWDWITSNCPIGEPVFLEDINIEGYSYTSIKLKVHALVKEGVLSSIVPGVYQRKGEHFSVEEVVKFKYLYRNGHHIGYPTGESALKYLGIIDYDPDAFRIATNKETPTNKTGRTKKFMGQKLRIRGSAIPIDDSNWNVLMILDLATNIVKYLKGFAPDRAYEIMADYVNENGITYEELSQYQNKYAFSYNALRMLFHTAELRSE